MRRQGICLEALFGEQAHTSFLFFLNFYWHVVAFQSRAIFYYRAKSINHAHTDIPSFLHFLPTQVTTKH